MIRCRASFLFTSKYREEICACPFSVLLPYDNIRSIHLKVVLVNHSGYYKLHLLADRRCLTCFTQLFHVMNAITAACGKAGAEHRVMVWHHHPARRRRYLFDEYPGHDG